MELTRTESALLGEDEHQNRKREPRAGGEEPCPSPGLERRAPDSGGESPDPWPSQILGLLSPLLGAGPPFLAPCKPSAFLAGVPMRAWMPSSPRSVPQTDRQFQLYNTFLSFPGSNSYFSAGQFQHQDLLLYCRLVGVSDGHPCGPMRALSTAFRPLSPLWLPGAACLSRAPTTPLCSLCPHLPGGPSVTHLCGVRGT